MGLMNYTKYLTMKAQWVVNNSMDPDFRTPNYGQPQLLRCFKYGESESKRTDRGYEFINSMVYVSDNPNVIEGDLLDGYTVKVVSKYYDFNGNDTLGLYCYKCW